MTKRLQTIAWAALLLDEEERNEDTVLRTQKRSYWFHSWPQGRKEKGCYHNLFKELLLEDTKSFRESVSFNLSSISSSMFSAAMFPTNSVQILSLRRAYRIKIFLSQVVKFFFGQFPFNI